MSRPVRSLASPPGVRTWTAPGWDPKAIAADYLLELREAAERGPIDGQWLAQLNAWLAYELREAYAPEQAQLALARLEPLIAKFERQGLEAAQANERVAARTSPVAAPDTVSRSSYSEQTSTPARRLNGQALRTSIVPTWLALVALSWVSLIWG